MEFYRIAANEGDTYGMERLGHLLIRKNKDDAEAYDWYKKAADLGRASAFGSIASCYEFGNGGVEKNVETALEWYKKGAEKGDSYSTVELYTLYMRQEQYKLAYEYAKLLYEQDNKQGYRYIYCLYTGTGTEKNVKLAFELANKLPDGDDKFRLLALFYEEGIGTTINYEQAAKYYKAMNSEWGNKKAKQLGY